VRQTISEVILVAKKGMKRPDVRDTHGATNKQAQEKRAETASVPEALNIFNNENNNPVQNCRRHADGVESSDKERSRDQTEKDNYQNILTNKNANQNLPSRPQTKHNEPQENKGQNWHNHYNAVDGGQGQNQNNTSAENKTDSGIDKPKRNK